MAFQYTSPSGIKLNPAEDQLLESIDSFNYPLNRWGNLGALHQNLRGGVVLSDKQKTRHFRYELTVAECKDIINKLDVEISKIKDKLSTLKTRFNEARNNHDRDRANRIEEEMGHLGMKLEGLKSKRDVYQRAIRNGNGKIKIEIEGDFDILGEYLPKEKQVILYYYTIHKYPNPCYLLAVVYVHEMMHAYLDVGSIKEYFEKIEEPIAEYGMLRFFKQFGSATSTYPGILEFAQTDVEEKQGAFGKAYYGFGYCVFMNPNGVDWLEDYRNAKHSLVESDPNVATYLDFWKTDIYPGGKEKECLEALYKALHFGVSKKMKVKIAAPPKMGIAEQSRNKNDLIEKLNVYLAHHPNVFLANAVNPTDHETRLYRGWADSSARQYFDWLDPKIHPELIPLLQKHRLSGSIYTCTDLRQATEIFTELVDNRTPEAKRANGNNNNMVSAIRHFIEHLLEINGIVL